MNVEALDTQTLLPAMREQGVRLWTDGIRLRWQAPKGAMTAAGLTVLNAYRDGIVAALAREQAEQDAEHWAVVAADCAQRGLRLIDPPRRERSQSSGSKACAWCRGRKFWRSVDAAVVCAKCYPPAMPELVVEEFDLEYI